MTSGTTGFSSGYCRVDPVDATGCIVLTTTLTLAGSLSPDSFTLSGSNYEIHAIMYFSSTNSLYFLLDTSLPSESAARMTLTVGSNSWSLADATATTGSLSSIPGFQWIVSSSLFSPGSTYTVSLTVPGGGSGSSESRSSSERRSSSKATPIPTAPPIPPRTCEELPDSVTVSGDGVGEQCRVITNAEGVGNDDIVEAGFLSALDVWSYLGRGVNVCFAQTGEIVLLDASTAPRTPYALASTSSDGETCAFIDRPGTVVLMPSDAPLLTTLPTLTTTRGLNATATATEAVWTNCMVTATHNLNLRDAPAGQIIGLVRFGWRLTAWQRDSGWYEVDVHGVTGWISGDYVTTDGDCN